MPELRPKPYRPRVPWRAVDLHWHPSGVVVVVTLICAGIAPYVIAAIEASIRLGEPTLPMDIGADTTWVQYVQMWLYWTWSILIALWLLTVARSFWRASRGRCPRCGHDLTGSGAVCNECGYRYRSLEGQRRRRRKSRQAGP